MRLLLVRRAETDTNVALRYGGQAAVPLNERGRRQAALVAHRLASEQAGALFTSDLVRAVETATIIGETVKLAAQPLPELREIDVGQWEALTPEELYQRFPDQIREFARNPARPLRQGGESYAQLQQRVEQVLARLSTQGNATVLAVTHGGVIRSALQTVIGLELAAFPQIALDPSGITELRHGPAGWRLHRLNDTAHLG